MEEREALPVRSLIGLWKRVRPWLELDARPNGARGGHDWTRLVASALLLAAFTAASGDQTQRTLSDVVGDRRLDYVLQEIIEQAELNAASPDAIDVADKSTDSDPVPLVADYSRALPGDTIDLIIEGEVDRATLEAIGVQVNTQVAAITTARAPIAVLPAVLSVSGLTRLSAAREVRPMLDVSVSETDADALWGGSPPNFPSGGLTGRNVVVGIVDTGLDLNHADFRTSQNNTRVKYIWDQTSTGTMPIGFTYGKEITEAQINAGQASSFWDIDGHGTHVAGVAAGNGRATGNGQPAYQYVGVAPEADLVIVKLVPVESSVVDAVNYVFQKAAAMGKKAVVNLSWSSLFGPRDGSYFLDTAISALTGPGKLVTAAAGNYGNVAVHARIDLPSGATTTMQFVVPVYSPNDVGSEYVSLEGWHDHSAAFNVKLTSPTGIQTPLLSPGQNSGDMFTADGRIYLDNDVNSTTKAKRIYVHLRRSDGPLVHPKEGVWTLTLTRRSGTTSGIFDFWITMWTLGTITSPYFTGSVVDQSRTVTSPAMADSVIATGAYATKVRWTNGTGGTSLFSGNPTVGAIAYFSSQGPRRDGVQRPDVVAPGYGVSAALSSLASTNSNWKMLDQVHWMCFGTSIANAHTTGALALMLQADPGLTPSKARLMLRRQARVDSYTGPTPNKSYGYGKLDLAPNATDAGDGLPPYFAFAPPFPNPSLGEAVFSFVLSKANLANANSQVELRIVDVRGRVVNVLPGSAAPGPQQVTWDGRAANGSRVPSGVYFAHLAVGDRVSVRKFVRIDG